MNESVYSPAQWAWIAERFREGYTIRSLADFLGVSRETVRRHLQAMGVKPYGLDELTPLDERMKEFNDLRRYDVRKRNC